LLAIAAVMAAAALAVFMLAVRRERAS
jgi:hypothetical protein